MDVSQASRRPSTGRPVSKYCAKKLPMQHKNTVVDYRERKAAIDHYDLYGMQATLDTLYGKLGPLARETKRKQIYTWVKKRAVINTMASSARTAKMKCRRDRGTGTTLSKEVEENLARWVQGMRKDGVRVTYDMLRAMALEATVDIGYETISFELSGTGYKGSNNVMVCRFVHAHRIKKVVQDERIDRIYNADQTAINYEYLPTKTLNKCGDNTVWVKCGGKTKERMTAMLLADNTGFKHPLFLVLRTSKSKVKATVQENLTTRNSFGKRLWNGVVRLQERHGCQIHGNRTAWWNGSLSMKFLEYHFAQRPDRATKKVLLIWDDFSAHFTEEVVAFAEELNVVLERVPPSYTWICQPADVTWNKPLKTVLRQNWLDSIKQQLVQAKERGIGFKLVPPTRETIVSWVTTAWSDLAKSTIVNGFKKCRLVDGIPEFDTIGGGVVDDDLLAALMESHSIDDTIDATRDFGNVENIDERNSDLSEL
ncbi:hypothetical protein Ae201684P_018303 [Aphanomyces euteiches]|uniref:DDE-1 domain-containing protein n=1 Tax=Aphanomyces euteiches TaxID=100861 RepID=A0A6G0XW57_9STRA|nr:hypothetical protein Ae201684_001211 [Aphanomyces euteiches]KAH9099286.1 hypothetical protein Ae201684P_018303 [Aphanomyces euteiches]